MKRFLLKLDWNSFWESLGLGATGTGEAWDRLRQSIVAKRVQLPSRCDSIGDQRKKVRWAKFGKIQVDPDPSTNMVGWEYGPFCFGKRYENFRLGSSSTIGRYFPHEIVEPRVSLPVQDSYDVETAFYQKAFLLGAVWKEDAKSCCQMSYFLSLSHIYI